ncbi:MAG TPA: type II toxin-antitoxin system VapC family toxin [Bryobacteraceae bacterium]|nr:type II toxin-antitoxin system VapC family toxin [Bryobacteraceae bacterium]
MSAYVLDASVAAKWVLPPHGESLVAEAFSIRQQFTLGTLELIVPDLFWAEMVNILWKATRAGRMAPDAAADAIKYLSAFRPAVVPSQHLWEHAFPIATGFRRSAYDCIYVALAARSGRALLTADERLANGLAAHFPIRWLGAI